MTLLQMLIDRGLLEPRRAAALRAEADEADRPVVEFLVAREGLDEEMLAQLLAEAVGTVVVDLEGATVDPAALGAVPAAVARRHLALPLAIDPRGRRLRVAMADPLDEAALDALRRAGGAALEPVVAPVSALLGALDRELGGPTTHVAERGHARRSELPSEPTQRVERRALLGEESGVHTEPVHRLEDEATLEQRFEALLLTLIEAGQLTRADYVRTLQRLLGRR